MNSFQRRFQRALFEKIAFTPLGPQAAGPGGAAVDPAAAGGAPMDPMAAGGAPPMDPAMGGMPPMDPAAAGGMPPADPAAGAPPMDPAAMGGMPPMDPAAMGGEPPAPEETPAPETPPVVNDPNADADGDGKPDTMVPLTPMKEFAIGIIEAMKGKKTQDAADPNAAKPAGEEGGMAPGPVTGLPGDMSGFGAPGSSGPVKLGSALVKVLARGR